MDLQGIITFSVNGHPHVLLGIMLLDLAGLDRLHLDLILPSRLQLLSI